MKKNVPVPQERAASQYLYLLVKVRTYRCGPHPDFLVVAIPIPSGEGQNAMAVVAARATHPSQYLYLLVKVRTTRL